MMTIKTANYAHLLDLYSKTELLYQQDHLNKVNLHLNKMNKYPPPLLFNNFELALNRKSKTLKPRIIEAAHLEWEVCLICIIITH